MSQKVDSINSQQAGELSCSNKLSSHNKLSRRKFLQYGAGALSLPLLGGLSLGGLSGCGDLADEVIDGMRKITDDAGRELTIPVAKDITKVYFTSPLAQIYVFSLNPDILGGTCQSYSEDALKYLPDQMRNLKMMGSLSNGGQIDQEQLMAEGIQIVFSISGVELSPSNISDAERLQTNTNIPVVLIDGSFDKISSAYQFLGSILGCESRANEISQYLERVYKDVTSAVSDIPDDQKRKLYYAEGPMGTSTEPESSQHAKAFQVAGAHNVADVAESTASFGMSSVSVEQVLAWNPEIIISWDDDIRGGAASYIKTSKDWATMDAVKNNRVYAMPSLPFSWCDRPNGVQRWLGIQWLANLMYPDKYNVDMVEEARYFYSLVYHIEITDDDAKEILGDSYPVRAWQWC